MLFRNSNRAFSNREARPWILAGTATLTLLVITLAADTVQAQTAFQGIGDLPGGDYRSNRPSASADARIITGQSMSDNGFVPFLWTVENGMLPLEPLVDNNSGILNDISADGRVIVGYTAANGPSKVMVWRDGIVTEGLGGLDGNYVSTAAISVSDDGRRILASAQGQVERELLLWSEENGWQVIPGNVGFNYTAFGLSGDGSTVFGYIEDLDPPTNEDRYSTFRWTEASGYTTVNLDPTIFIGVDVSFDGTTIVGLQRDESFANHAVKWSTESGLVFLEETPGAIGSIARAISPDGKFIVGGSQIEDGVIPTLWEDGVGMLNIPEILEQDLGVDLTGWRLNYLEFLSDDGTVVGGVATNPDGNQEVWRADLACGSAVGKRQSAACTCPVYEWLPNQGISFGVGSNWNPDGPPDVSGIARFESSGFIPVEFLAADTTNGLEILMGRVSFDLKGFQYELTGEINCGPALLVKGSTAEFKIDGEGSILRASTTALIDRGTMSVTGGAAFVARNLRMGESGTATLNLDAGFIRGVNKMALGITADSDALLEVDGGGETYLLLPPSVEIGVQGSGILRLAANANLQGPILNDVSDSPLTIVLGVNEGSEGIFEIDGGGVVTFPDDFDRNISMVVGEQGRGTLNLVNGGSLRIDELDISKPGRGSVMLTNGGVLVIDSTLTLGDHSDAVASLTVSGDPSALGIGEYLFLGLGGTATLTVQDGGLMMNALAQVDTTNVFIGGFDNAEGDLVVNNGKFLTLDTVPTIVTVGASGRGDVQVTNAGRIEVDEIWIGRTDTGYGSVYVGGAGSRLQTDRLAVGPGAFGVLQVEDDALVSTDLLWVADHGQIIGDVLAVGTWEPSKQAAGMYAGGLLLSDEAQLDVTSLDLAADAVLGGTATWTLPLVNSGGVQPGDFNDPTGTFTAGVGYEQTDTGTLAIDLGGLAAGVDHDQLVVTGSAALDGTLRVALVGDYIPNTSDTFTVLTADAVSGTFATIETPAGLEVEATYNAGSVVLTVVGDVTVAVDEDTPEPTVTGLHPNYPNPFSGATTLVVELAEASEVRLMVYDLLGREVARVFEGSLPGGVHELSFDARRLPSGTYVSRLITTDSRGANRRGFARVMVVM